jgi:hypothetical protein
VWLFEIGIHDDPLGHCDSGMRHWRRPQMRNCASGIHNPELWLWIPGSMLRIAPE